LAYKIEYLHVWKNKVFSLETLYFAEEAFVVKDLHIPFIYAVGTGHHYFVKRGKGNGSIPGNFFIYKLL